MYLRRWLCSAFVKAIMLLTLSTAHPISTVETSDTVSSPPITLAAIKAFPVIEFLKLFLAASSTDSLFDLGDISLTTMPIMQDFVGPRGSYFVVYDDPNHFQILESVNRCKSTVFIRSTFDFLLSPSAAVDEVTEAGADSAADSASKAQAASINPITFDALMEHLPTCPSVIKISTADSMLLQHSALLSKCRVVFYLSNEYASHSKDIIDMMMHAGL